MDRQSLMLAALAASDGATHSPVQVQKLFFLLDKRIPSYTGGPHFHFIPYDYGPFDPEVYDELHKLEQKGLVIIEHQPSTRWKSYRLTPQGQQWGEKLLGEIDEIARRYIRDVSRWVRSLSFAQLVSAIYKAYPEMQVNSVFRY
jgi:uncharacterized protein